MVTGDYRVEHGEPDSSLEVLPGPRPWGHSVVRVQVLDQVLDEGPVQVQDLVHLVEVGIEVAVQVLGEVLEQAVHRLGQDSGLVLVVARSGFVGHPARAGQAGRPAQERWRPAGPWPAGRLEPVGQGRRRAGPHGRAYQGTRPGAPS